MISPYLRIGLIVRTHGVRGAVKLDPATDDPARFKGLKEAFLELHGQYVPVRLSVISAQSGAVIAHIEGYDTPEAAQKLKNVFLCVDRAHAVSLPEGTYFVADLLGMETFDTEGNAYGRITDVYETGANDVYEIAHGKLLVPALKRVLETVDTAAGRMVFHADVLKEVGLFSEE